MEPIDPPLSPRKRLKIDGGTAVDASGTSTADQEHLSTKISSTNNNTNMAQNVETTQDLLQKETDVGILQYVHQDLLGFGGVLKKRYTDFLVNEIMIDGTVVHLDSYKFPRPVRNSSADVASQTTLEVHDANIQPGQSKEATEGVNADQGSTQLHAASEIPDEKSSGSQVQGVSAKEDPKEDVEVKSQSQETAENVPESGPKDISGSSDWKQYAEKQPTFSLSKEDRAVLEKHLGQLVTDNALALFNRIVDFPHKKPSQYGVVKSEKPIDREARTHLHQDIRRIFVSRLESYTDPDGTFVLAAPQSSGRSSTATRGKPGHGRGGRNEGHNSRDSQKNTKARFADLGGEYCHFSLYKENKDTMEVISFIARETNKPVKVFQFAGTKDRRAVTVQRVSAHRMFSDSLARLNKKLRGSKIGNFAHSNDALALGDLKGNEFVITLRNCTFQESQGKALDDQIQHAESIVKASTEHLVKDGFLNYYGLQRFGSFSTRTDAAGVKVLQGDYEGAVNAILHSGPEILHAAQHHASASNYPSDDLARALAIDMFRKTGQLEPALKTLPRKYSAESNIIRFLCGRNRETDFLGAIQMIPRNLRLMYVHAYQSLVWNHAASHRWSVVGNRVVEGDLVMVNEHKDKEENGNADMAQVDEDGEPIVRPSGDDRAITDDERFERARALSKGEAESGKYSIFDVVLPTPGFDVIYPSHMKAFYEELMGREEFGGLDPHDMRRRVKDFSLSGNYRKLLARPIGACDYRVVRYTEEDQQFVKTDVGRLTEQFEQKKAHEHSAQEDKAASAAHEQTVPHHMMGLDGALESKIVEVKEALFSIQGPANDQPTEDGPATEATAQQTAAEAEGDAMEVDNAEDTTKSLEKIAVVLTLQLGASTYATMALRELSKGGIRAYKPDFGGGR